MRHQVKGKKLSRDTAHRKAMLRNLAISLIKEHRIETTVARAKALRGFVEPLITRAKEDSNHNRRQVFSSLQNKHAVKALFDEVGPAAADRPGGYTRVIRTGYRQGDNAELALIELVDFNDVKPETKKSTRKKTRRAGKSNKPTTSKEEEASSKQKNNQDEEAKKNQNSDK